MPPSHIALHHLSQGPLEDVEDVESLSQSPLEDVVGVESISQSPLEDVAGMESLSQGSVEDVAGVESLSHGSVEELSQFHRSVRYEIWRCARIRLCVQSTAQPSQDTTLIMPIATSTSVSIH